MVEGAARISSTAIRVQMLVSRGKSSSASPWDVPPALTQPGLVSPTRDQLSGEERLARTSWKRPKEG